MLLILKHFNPALAARLGLLSSLAFLAYGIATRNQITIIMGALSLPISLAQIRKFRRPGAAKPGQ
jgi:hypothetical protein